jgi:NAD(P)-dependent dehydrogenase (short-subunit alcohol dehydrogenase family)
MNTTLPGQTALVTGSTRGIGRGIAELLAKMGTRVILSGRDAERGSEVTDAIRAAGGSADFISADLTSMHSVRELVRQANDLAGPVDVLINNAGVYPFTATTDVTVEEFDSVYAVAGPSSISPHLRRPRASPDHPSIPPARHRSKHSRKCGRPSSAQTACASTR